MELSTEHHGVQNLTSWNLTCNTMERNKNRVFERSKCFDDMTSYGFESLSKGTNHEKGRSPGSWAVASWQAGRRARLPAAERRAGRRSGRFIHEMLGFNKIALWGAYVMLYHGNQ
jgi:hypothetical protein